MVGEGKISMPMGFGGLLRYDSEYRSKIMLKPSHIIMFIIAIILFVLALKVFVPVQ